MKINLILALCLMWAALLAPNFASAQEEKSDFSGEVSQYAKEIQRITTQMQSLRMEMEKLKAADKNDPKINELENQLEDMEEELEKESERLEEAVEELQDDIRDNYGNYSYNYEYEVDDEDGDTTIHIKSDDSTAKNDEIVIRIGDNGICWKKGDEEAKMKKKKKDLPKFKTQMLGLDLGVNAFAQKLSNSGPAERDPMELDVAKSISVTLHLFRQGISLYKNHVYMTMGLAMDFQNYRLAKDISLAPETDSFKYAVLPEKLKKGKLEANYLTVPVMLCVESNPRHPNRSFKAGFGGWGGVRYNSYTKQVTTQGKKEKYHDDFNLNPINYGLRAQVGYGPFTLYGQYAMSPLFAENRGAPELNPVTVGLVVNGFKWR